MTTNKKEEVRNRSKMLAELRELHCQPVKQAKEILKEYQATRTSLQRAMLGEAKSVPQLAESTGIPAHVVLWYIAAMKKYGLVVEAGLDENGDYYLYELSQEAKV
jgi:hypothetical protein